MASYKSDYIAVNQYTRPGSKLAKVAGIVMHYTANPGATAENHKRYFGNGGGGRYAGAHIFVDKTEALCIIPLNEIAYHANEKACRITKLKGRSSSYYGDANCTAIGIEMCIEKDSSISELTFERSVKIVAELCKKYGLDSGDIYRHYDVTGKNCPAPWVSEPSEFVRFKKEVAQALKPTITTVSKPNSAQAKAQYFTENPGKIRVKKTCNQYKTTEFTQKNFVQTVAVGPTMYTVDKIVKTSAGTPRLLMKNGNYMTANKDYVTKV